MNKFKTKHGYINLDHVIYIHFGTRQLIMVNNNQNLILGVEDFKNLINFLDAKQESTPIYIRKDADSYTLTIKNVDFIANVLENIK